ncbi:NADP-dependent glyceraldehyde-3-phosphate dehydrogenase, putative [Ricinus communis]|uniref:NADP-dependent glyceraldehyde-3-phosphate dehydrogenase n=1 Tax=Ricinus communis TaxID=3988 RepID=B9SXQ7_RICCO|nr:NADP-dependent glyceraldehyde-3-phosphate dehydrogenase, putative [Ricinus communis]
MELAKSAQKAWARTPLWKRAELFHKAAAILKEHKAPIAECLVKEIAKPAKDAFSEVVRSGDLIFNTAVEGVRILGDGKFLVSDSFPGNERTKYCLTSKSYLKTNKKNIEIRNYIPCFNGNQILFFPKGLISCVTGKGFEIGDFLTMHLGVNCISFIGGDTSIAISKKARMIPLQMVFGGKDACIAIPGRC